jgi:large subunit ribosomal protein L4
MTTIKVHNQQSDEIGELELSDVVFSAEVKQHLLHAVVRKQLAARRAGTHAVKRRSDVRGGGRKPFKQKGTGRARQGTIRAAQMRGGGVVFGPIPRSYDFKVNKREMRAALRGALTLRVAAGDALVVDDIGFDAPKTKQFI